VAILVASTTYTALLRTQGAIIGQALGALLGVGYWLWRRRRERS
jgi:hypothetical protein